MVNLVNPGWEFDRFTATPYFLVLVAVATLGLFADANALSLAGAYVLSALEVLGLWCTVSVGLGRPSGAYLYLRRFGLRRRAYPDTLVLLTGRGLYMVLITYGFTVYYFAALYFLLLRYDPSSFVGLAYSSRIDQFVGSLYFSCITITTLGYADMYPHAAISRLFVVLEVFVGLAFTLFFFAAFVAFHVNSLSNRHD
jgi:hypothetical protein